VAIPVPSCPVELEAAAEGIFRGGFGLARVPATWRIVVVIALQASSRIRKPPLYPSQLYRGCRVRNVNSPCRHRSMDMDDVVPSTNSAQTKSTPPLETAIWLM
jgi:hypothetical protein